MFHCGEIQLSQCHSELVSGCQAECTVKYPLFSSEGEAIQPIFNSKFVNESTSSQPSPQGEGESGYVECIGKKPCESLEILRLNSVDLSQSKGLSLRMTGLFYNSDQCRHPEQSEGSLSERIGEFPSPREEGLGERVLPFATLAVHGIIKKCAFTLAEVLITLGIIGVVAAITIPILSTRVQVKVLENQFKKADAMFQQALKASVQELGYDDINDFNIPGRYSSSSYEDLKSDISSLNLVWLKQFSSFQNFYIEDANRKNIRYYTLTGTPTYDYYYTMSGSRNVYILQNGVLVSDLFACSYGTNHPAGVCFIFDTNGPYKGPNRVGHDIFRYFSVYNAYPDFCNPNTKNSANTTSCYGFARKNMNPKDNTSPYWTILFKPKSYWGL